jgi:hypothetical protein
MIIETKHVGLKKYCLACCIVQYGGPSIIRIPGRSGQFWANYSPAFPLKRLLHRIIISTLPYAVRYSIFALRSFYLSTIYEDITQKAQSREGEKGRGIKEKGNG